MIKEEDRHDFQCHVTKAQLKQDDGRDGFQGSGLEIQGQGSPTATRAAAVIVSHIASSFDVVPIPFKGQVHQIAAWFEQSSTGTPPVVDGIRR